MEKHSAEHHVLPYRLYVVVWLALVCLTGLTVGAKYTDLQHMAIIAAILIATTKAALVLLYFMHIRYEKPVFAITELYGIHLHHV